MMCKCKEMKFSDAVWVNPPVPLKRGKDYPFVEMKDVNPSERSARAKQNRPFSGGGSRFIVGDTLMARITPCLENGKTAQFMAEDVGAVAHGSTEFIVVRGRPGVSDTDFAYYLTRWREVQDFAIAQMTGTSGRQRVPTEALSHLTVPIPSLPEQQAIADILGSLDDKIELNCKINETLEGMARAVFKSWFIDFDPVCAKIQGRQPDGMNAETAKLFPNSFEDSETGRIPKGWKVETLDSLVAFALGGDWGSDSATADSPILALCIRGADIPDLQAGGIGKMPRRYLKKSSLEKRRLQAGDLVIEVSGGSPTQSTGRPVLILTELVERIEVPLVCSNFCRCIRFKNPPFSTFVFLWLRYLYDNDEFLQFENGTTGIKNFAFTDFCRDFPVVIPSDEVVDAFANVVSPLLATRQSNGRQCDGIARLRDALLPKLLSGELQVANLKGNKEAV